MRPSWDCAACGNPWPCAIAKESMLAEFREHPSVLVIYMSGRLNDAFDDLTAGGRQVPPDLYDRFLGWIVITPRTTPEEPDIPSEEGHGENRLPRQGRGRSPSDPTERSPQSGQDRPPRGGGTPPTRSDPSHHGGHHRFRLGSPARPYKSMDL